MIPIKRNMTAEERKQFYREMYECEKKGLIEFFHLQDYPKEKLNDFLINSLLGYEDFLFEDGIIKDVEQLKWRKFCTNLLNIVEDYAPYDPDVQLDMSYGEVFEELSIRKSLDDLSPQLKTIAEQFKLSV